MLSATSLCLQEWALLKSTPLEQVALVTAQEKALAALETTTLILEEWVEAMALVHTEEATNKWEEALDHLLDLFKAEQDLPKQTLKSSDKAKTTQA